MNGPILIAGVAAAFCALGHFTVGRKQYLKPMLAASFDDVAKRVNHCVFHSGVVGRWPAADWRRNNV
jgi:hypothetical protein